MSLPKLCVVGDVVEYERLSDRDERVAFDRELWNPPARRSEPTLSQTVIVSPGSSARISTSPGACCLSSWGFPLSSGKVP